MGVRGHHHAVAQLGGGYSALRTSPGHHGCRRCNAAFENLVPAYHLASLGVQIGLDALQLIALQLGLGSQAELLHLRLAVRAALPAQTRGLVAAYVDVLAREKLADLIQHVLQELEGALLAQTEHVLADSPGGAHLVRAAGAAELRVAGQGSHGMARHFYLRNHGNLACSGVCDYVAYLILGVEAAVRTAVIALLLVEVMAYLGFLAH